jgi:hypothetical protein
MVEHPMSPNPLPGAPAPRPPMPQPTAAPTWWQSIDRLLRGDATRLSALKAGTIELPENGISLAILGMGAFYGVCMGLFALFNKGDIASALLQVLSTMAKVPALFFATLLVTFPSLYVFNALIGSRLTLGAVWRLMIAMLAVTMAILASLGPVVAFFSISTTNYPFMLLLHVGVFGVAGFLGLKFLLHTLHRLTLVLNEPAAPKAANPPVPQAKPLIPEAVPGEPRTAIAAPKVDAGALEKVDDRMLGANVKQVFYLWIVAFGLVGAQMSWLLRPFISAPDRPFVLFSPRESNFYAAVGDALMRVMGWN